MKPEDSRTYWNKKAAFFASKEKQQKSRRVGKLYEESCWHYIEPVLPPIENGTILEAGCGAGRWVFRLAPMGYRVELLDLSEEMIKHARERVGQHGLDDFVPAYHALDICDMHTLAADNFDLVLALGVPVSLSGNPKKAIEEFSRITKPGGCVVCDVMNRYRTALDLARKNDFSQFFEVLYNGRMTSKSGLPQYHFGSRELENLFQEKGFELLRIAALCPFFEAPATKEHVDILDDDDMYQAIQKAFKAFAEDPNIIGLSSRLLVVARKKT